MDVANESAETPDDYMHSDDYKRMFGRMNTADHEDVEFYADALANHTIGLHGRAHLLGVKPPPLPDYLRKHRSCHHRAIVFDRASGGEQAIFNKTRMTYNKMLSQKVRRAEMKIGFHAQQRHDLKRCDRERKATRRAARARSTLAHSKVVWRMISTMNPSE